MPNIAREMAKYPSPSLSWGRNLANQSIKNLPSNKQLGVLKSYLNSQTPLLKKASQNIILNTDTLKLFFEKLAGSSLSGTAKSLSSALSIKPSKLPAVGKAIPETRQFMDYASGGDMQKTIIQNPINRSMDNVGNPQPVFPNKSL